MSPNNNKKKYSCPSRAIFPPSRLRMIYFPISLFISWAAVFFKARGAESWPWFALLLATVFALGILAAEILISACFTRYLALALYGFLAGAGVNVIIQGLLNRFQGLNWAFQSPVLFSLGTLLLGFLGVRIFVFHGEEIKKILPFLFFSRVQSEAKANLRAFSAVLWIITSLLALGLCMNLFVILGFYRELETINPLRKPLWFSVGVIIFIFLIAVLSRKDSSSLVRIFFPGIICGLAWASILRDLFIGVFLKFPDFPLSSEVLEFLLVIHFCFLGLALLNRAEYNS